jgi:DNA-binding PadR family transcriptional regulator
MKSKSSSAVEREILRPLWKVHILHHAGESPIVAHWMMEELREHGYRVSPGTLYPMMARMTKIGWLKRTAGGKYSLAAGGRKALAEVLARLAELGGEALPPKGHHSHRPR